MRLSEKPLSLTFILVAAGALACAFAGVARAADSPKHPNFVFIISDDQRWDTLGIAGNPRIHTPNLDQLGRDGVYFRQGTIYVSQCTPSRSMLLTGLTPHQNGWYSNQSQRADVVDPDGFHQYPLFPAILRDAGYRTVLVGKWHVTPRPWNCGFSDVRSWYPGGGGVYQGLPLAHGKSKATTQSTGFVNELFAQDAIEFLKSDDATSKPFFLWLALTAPHQPLFPNPPRIEKLYEGKETRDLLPPGFPTDVVPADFKHYYEAISLVDDLTGQILRTLDERKLADNTVVVFLGDNGFMMGSRGIAQKGAAGKVVPWEESVRVPFIIRAPGIAKAKGTNDTPVSSIDLPPTFLRMAGIKPPANWPGRNLVPVLDNSSPDSITDAVCEFADDQSKQFGHLAYRLIRTPKYKLIVWEKSDKPSEMYDLLADPRETKNIIDAPAVQKIREDLKDRLTAWLKRTEDPALKWMK